MTMLEDTDSDDREVGNGVEQEAANVSNESLRLQEDTCKAEQEEKARASLHLREVAPEVTGLYQVLDAAGALIAAAKACHPGGSFKSAVRSKLREIVDSGCSIVDDVTDLVKQSLKAGQSEPQDDN